MRPLDTGTLLLGAATVGAIAIAATSKDSQMRSLFYSIATGTGVGAISLYLVERQADLERQQALPASAPPLPLPTGGPRPTLPPITAPPAPAPGPAAPPPAPGPAPPTPGPAAPPAPSAPPQPARPNNIGCTPMSGTLPAPAVNQARGLIALNPASPDIRFRPSLVSVITMRRLANDLRGCGSALGFNPTRDALVRDLEEAATRFETALGGPAVGLSNVLRFAT